MKRVLLLPALALALPAAALAEISEDSLRNISLGMKKEAVLAALGRPEKEYSDGKNAEGKEVTVLEYRVAGMMDFPQEGYTVDPRSLGKSYGIDRPQPPPKHKGTKGYDCGLVIIDGALGRVEKRL